MPTCQRENKLQIAEVPVMPPATHVYCGLYTAKSSVIYGKYTIIYDIDLRIIRNRVDFIQSSVLKEIW